MTGGALWLDEFVNDPLLNCTSLDVIAIHACIVGDYETRLFSPT